MTKGLRKSIKVRNGLYKKWLTTQNIYYHKRCKIYQNRVVSINKAFVYFAKTKTKKVCDNVNLIINKKRPSSNIDNLKVKDKDLHHSSSISKLMLLTGTSAMFRLNLDRNCLKRIATTQPICIFPNNLKIAKVIPILKQGSRSSCNNYRPISVLSSLSKIFERCILNQLSFYLTYEDILVPNQYGFRSGMTTVDWW